MSLPPVRRVVTGHRAGRAVIAMDGAPPTVVSLKAVPGVIFHELWNTTTMPVAIDNAADPTMKPLALEPSPNGSIIRIVDIPPDSEQNTVSSEQARAAFAEMGAAHAKTGAGDTQHRFMHRTETVDYGILLAGEIWLVVDEGEVKLAPGDVVIQRGTNHAWSNRSAEPARMLFILLNGRFTSEVR